MYGSDRDERFELMYCHYECHFYWSAVKGPSRLCIQARDYADPRALFSYQVFGRIKT